MRTAYSFSILRYVHDPVTQEFVNVGVALYAPEAGFFRARCSSHYGRISGFFTHIDGNRFRHLTRYIEDSINAMGDQIRGQLPLSAPLSIEGCLARVLPPDDSALQFAPAGGGFSADLEATLRETFHRCVETYAAAETPRRAAAEVWRVFSAPLEGRRLAAKLVSKKIAARDYEREFAHAWKNQIWHVYEPVSFDLAEGADLAEKASRWLGRATALRDAPEPFKLHLLLGRPQDPKLAGAMIKAENILNKIPGKKEIVKEEEAEAFAAAMERDMAHDGAGRA